MNLHDLLPQEIVELNKHFSHVIFSDPKIPKPPFAVARKFESTGRVVRMSIDRGGRLKNDPLLDTVTLYSVQTESEFRKSQGFSK